MEYTVKNLDKSTSIVRKNASGRWERDVGGFVLGLDDDEAMAVLKSVIPAGELRSMFPMVGFTS